ncbi:glycosyltransferase family 4 protein [Elusimicrobiota bacterium]
MTGLKTLRICFVGWGDSIHMHRWMQPFVEKDYDVHLITNRPSEIKGVVQHELAKADAPPASRIKRILTLRANTRLVRSISRTLGIDMLRRALVIRGMIRAIEPDIVHLHTLMYPSFLAVLSGFHPMVITPWNGDIVWHTDWSLVRKLAVKKGLAAADLITVVSNEMRDRCLEYGDYAGKIQHISFLGVDTSRFRPALDSAGLRQQLKVPAGAPVIFSSRNLEELYNIDIILRAIPHVVKRFPSATFLFAWHSAGKKDELLELAGELSVLDSVRFVGKIPYGELPKYYSASDVYVSVPSGDIYGMSIIEAMACESALVVSDLPSVKEVITHGVNGSVVPVRDEAKTAEAIVSLLADDRLRKSFGEKNRRWVQNNAEYTGNIRKLERSYHSLAGKAGCRCR